MDAERSTSKLVALHVTWACRQGIAPVTISEKSRTFFIEGRGLNCCCQLLINATVVFKRNVGRKGYPGRDFKGWFLERIVIGNTNLTVISEDYNRKTPLKT